MFVAALLLYGVVFASAPERRPSSPYLDARDGDGRELGRGAAQSITTVGDERVAEYRYRNFNGDLLSTTGHIPVAVEEQSISEYGMPEAGLAELQAWFRETWAGVAKHANARFDALTEEDAREDEAAVATFKSRDEALVAEFRRRDAELHLDERENGKLLAVGRADNERWLALDRAARKVKLDAACAENQRRADAEYAATTAERERRKAALFSDAGLRLVDNKLAPDVRKMVRRNAPRLSAISAEMHAVAKGRGYRLGDAEGAVIALVQTAVGYKEPPERVLGKDLLGLLPPPYTFGEGWGDCDTKAALAASLLASWDAARIVGVRIPDHYLLGLQRIPTPGDIYVEWDGLPFVLVEAAGPGAHAPGHPGDGTLDFLKAGGKPDLEPLY